ncbi:MAG: GntR family transcriptional regulator [Thalassobaculaceae bacterium]|nr:GntR family transcriptional regulator [Thalassobaculaceae bacterium]
MATRGQSVARILRDGVLDGTYKPGARMNEVDISNTLGVSRTPVRGALGVLAAEGLLDYVPNSGYVVRRYTVQDVEDVYAARSVLEGLAARTVAERGLPDHSRGVLHKVLSETQALCDVQDWTDETRDTWASLNEAFHEAIFEAADNRHLRELIAKSRSIPQLLAVKFRWHDLDTLVESYSDHLEIFEAIADRQGARAEYLAREHVYRAGRRLIANWRRFETPSPVKRPARRVPHAA